MKVLTDHPLATVAAVLTGTDAELAVREQRRAKACVLKHGMVQALLTGRTRRGGPHAATT